ncbi:MAG: hypothetical protein IJ860_05760 [Eubacterium sp.]|nr:hypothetical protein [Eubacterium sp.]
MFEKYYGKLLKQLSIDYNCTSEDLLSTENVITGSALNEGRRSYSPGHPFLEMTTLGRNTVIMADPCLHDFLFVLSKDIEGHRLFELDNITKLNKELKTYGYQMTPTHHMFLPCLNAEPENRFQVRWLYDEINPFYGETCVFPTQLLSRNHALCDLTGLLSLHLMEILLWVWQDAQKMRRIGNK